MALDAINRSKNIGDYTQIGNIENIYRMIDNHITILANSNMDLTLINSVIPQICGDLLEIEKGLATYYHKVDLLRQMSIKFALPNLQDPRCIAMYLG